MTQHALDADSIREANEAVERIQRQIAESFRDEMRVAESQGDSERLEVLSAALARLERIGKDTESRECQPA